MRRRSNKLEVKSFGSTKELLSILLDLSLREDGGISDVGVESVDIRRNTESESIHLAKY